MAKLSDAIACTVAEIGKLSFEALAKLDPEQAAKFVAEAVSGNIDFDEGRSLLLTVGEVQEELLEYETRAFDGTVFERALVLIRERAAAEAAAAAKRQAAAPSKHVVELRQVGNPPHGNDAA